MIKIKYQRALHGVFTNGNPNKALPIICTSGADMHGIPQWSKGELILYKNPQPGSELVSLKIFSQTIMVHTCGVHFHGMYGALKNILIRSGLLDEDAISSKYYMKVIVTEEGTNR